MKITAQSSRRRRLRLRAGSQYYFSSRSKDLTSKRARAAAPKARVCILHSRQKAGATGKHSALSHERRGYITKTSTPGEATPINLSLNPQTTTTIRFGYFVEDVPRRLRNLRHDPDVDQSMNIYTPSTIRAARSGVPCGGLHAYRPTRKVARDLTNLLSTSRYDLGTTST